MPLEFYSNGKLMLTGEYFVLSGAKSLAMPVNRGQYLFIENAGSQNTLKWQSYEFNELWFNATYQFPDFNIENSSNRETAIYIQKLLLTLQELNSEIFNKGGIKIKAQLTFLRKWGLGSSSTLINNLAQWANVSPYELNKRISKGSGYDIACAQTERSFITYQLHNERPLVEGVSVNENLFGNMFFIYSGKKRSTEDAIRDFSIKQHANVIHELTELTHAFIKAKTVNEMCNIIKAHDELLANFLEEERLKTLLFKDFLGEIKPMGAWGGDFFMAVTNEKKQYVENYFASKGFNSIYNINDFLIR